MARVSGAGLASLTDRKDAMSPPYRRPSAALVVAFLALLVALSSTSFASEVTSAAKHLITGKEVKNGSLQVKDLSKKARKTLKGNRGRTGATGPQGVQGVQGAKGDQGIPGPTFGETVNASSTTVTGCGPSTLATQTITVKRTARVLASAGGAWDRNSTNLHTGTLSVELLKDGTVVAVSPPGFASSFSAEAQRIGLNVTAVLFAGSSAFPTAPTYYEAAPGTYTLRLQGGASDGTCTGNSTMWRSWLTYVLLGTSQ
jgi:hypothetical protein